MDNYDDVTYRDNEFSTTELSEETEEKRDSYQEIVEQIRKYASEPISEREVHTAARDLINFCRITLAVGKRQNQGEQP